MAETDRAGIAVADLPPAARFVLRGRAAAVGPAGEAFGVPLPQAACRANAQGPRAALWLGPDEWLLIGAAEDADAIADALCAALGALPHSLVRVSDRSVAVELRGAGAAALLASGCPLDLAPAAFPVGMCTRTVLGKAEIVLWRTAADAFRLEAWRSFRPYVLEWLDAAGADMAADDAPGVTSPADAGAAPASGAAADGRSRG